MFILKRQDVDIKNFQHPTKDQKIPILSYQGQTFRLLSIFSAAQQEEAALEPVGKPARYLRSAALSSLLTARHVGRVVHRARFAAMLESLS